jgi:PadR family transcriptional regulator PadR
MTAKAKKPDALQGALDLLVLKTLSRQPQHGYGVAARIQQITENNRRARIYHLTRAGQKHLSDEEARWTRLFEAVVKVMRLA